LKNKRLSFDPRGSHGNPGIPSPPEGVFPYCVDILMAFHLIRTAKTSEKSEKKPKKNESDFSSSDGKKEANKVKRRKSENDRIVFFIQWDKKILDESSFYFLAKVLVFPPLFGSSRMSSNWPL